MTTIANAVQQIKDHGYTDLSDTQVISALSEANQEVCAMEPWPFLEAQQSVTVNSGDTLAVTGNVQAILGVLDTTNMLQLRNCRMDDVLKDEAYRYGQTRSFAQAYYRVGATWHLDWPLDTPATYLVTYLASPAAFAATSDSWGSTPAQLQPTVVAFALAKCAAMVDDPQMAQYWEQLAIRRVQRAREFLWTSQYDGPDRIVNIMDDDIQLY